MCKNFTITKKKKYVNIVPENDKNLIEMCKVINRANNSFISRLLKLKLLLEVTFFFFLIVRNIKCLGHKADRLKKQVILDYKLHFTIMDCQEMKPIM